MSRESAAKTIAAYANHCCERLDGYQEDVERMVLAELERAAADMAERCERACIDLEAGANSREEASAYSQCADACRALKP